MPKLIQKCQPLCLFALIGPEGQRPLPGKGGVAISMKLARSVRGSNQGLTCPIFIFAGQPMFGDCCWRRFYRFQTGGDGAMQLAQLRAYSIPSIGEMFAVVAERFRVQIGEHFAEELAELSEPDRGFLVDAILVLTSYDAYAIHTRRLASPIEQVRDAWISALTTLLRT